VWQVDVNPGDRVNAGQRLLTLEAMKMETSLDSPVDGHVLDVLVGPGHQVSPGARLIVLSTNGATP
jgi:urea carboxylase